MHRFCTVKPMCAQTTTRQQMASPSRGAALLVTTSRLHYTQPSDGGYGRRSRLNSHPHTPGSGATPNNLFIAKASPPGSRDRPFLLFRWQFLTPISGGVEDAPSQADGISHRGAVLVVLSIMCCTATDPEETASRSGALARLIFAQPALAQRRRFLSSCYFKVTRKYPSRYGTESAREKSLIPFPAPFL